LIDGYVNLTPVSGADCRRVQRQHALLLLLFGGRLDGVTAETAAGGQAARPGPAQRPSFNSADVTTRTKAWKQFMSNYSSANK